MPKTNKYNDTLYNEEWVKQKYLIEEKSTIEIAKEIGCYRTAVNDALKRFGIKARGKISKYDLLRDKEWLRRKYVDEKLSLQDIADLTGSTRGNVGCHLETLGIKRRSINEACMMDGKGDYRKFVGEKHHSWQGGVTFDNNGRYLIKAPNHPKKRSHGYITRARHILETHYDKYVEDIGCQYQDCDKQEDYILHVHHKDGNKTKDEVDNLVVLCQYHHMQIEHGTMEENYVEVEKEEVVCN